MFTQIIDALAKIVGLLTDSGKLAEARNRKRVGRKFVELHQSLLRITANAKGITARLQTVLDLYAKYSGTHYPGFDYLLSSLQKDL